MTSRRRPLRIALFAVAAVLGVGVAAVAVLLARFDPNSYKPDIAQAVKHATGRDLALNGRISLKPSLWPTIQAEDVAFSNPAGFSRPQMATLQRLELQLALLPLLSSRFEIGRLVLIHPDILLETSAAGQPNWQVAPEVSPSAPAGAQSAVKSGKPTTAVSVASIRIQEGTIGYRDDRSGKITTVGLPKLEAVAASAGSPLHVDADATYNGATASLTADTGSLSRLQDAAATSPWPVKLVVTAGTAKLTADGSLKQPLLGKGYDFAVGGAAADLSTLTPWLQGLVPPPLHDVSFAARIVDKGAALPDVSALTLHAGASDLGAQFPGMTLSKLDIAAASPSQPIKADAAGMVGTQPLALAATLGPMAGPPFATMPAPYSVDATFQAAGATIAAKGTVADTWAMTGANIVLSAKIPDLSALSPLARRSLPAVRQLAFQGTLTDAAGGFRNGAGLHDMSLASPEGDLSGTVALGFGQRKSVSAILKSNRIDLDALQAVVDQTPAAASPAAAGSRPETPPPPKRNERLFSDQPIPFGLLRAADADLQLTIADLRSGGADYKTIATHAVVTDGKLGIEPFTAVLPEGRMSGSLTADATQTAPPVHLALHAPGLALKSILAGIHQPSFASGNLEVLADLRGAGDTPHAIAATLDGSLGIAMAGGVIDNRLLGSLLGKVMDTLNAIDLVGKGGTSEVKCFGARIDAQHGIGSFKALALSSSLLTMTGAGSVDLGNETLAMVLHPQARLGGNNVVIPVNVSGPIRNPAVGVNRLGAAAANAGTVAGAVVGGATQLGIVGALLGGDKLIGGGTSDICAPALAAARGQPVPQGAAARPAAPSAPAADAPAPKAINPNAILKNLLR